MSACGFKSSQAEAEPVEESKVEEPVKSEGKIP